MMKIKLTDIIVSARQNSLPSLINQAINTTKFSFTDPSQQNQYILHQLQEHVLYLTAPARPPDPSTVLDPHLCSSSVTSF